MTYKADTGDPRQSPATKVMELLQQEGAQISYVDPYAQTCKIGAMEYTTKNLSSSLVGKCDCALILTAHSCFDYEMIVEHAPVVLDTRNGTRHVKEEKDHVILL